LNLSSPRFDAVLFDLDGTLVDSAGDLAGAVEEMRMVRGLPTLGVSAYRSMAGTGARGMLGLGFGITPDGGGYEPMREEFFSNYERRITRTTAAFDGVETLLDWLERSRIRWGIVTNKAARFSEPLVAAMPLLGRSETLVSGDSTPYSKPHPAPLLEAARRMKIAPKHCIYVGDDERDIVAGRAAGMATAIAAWGYLGSKPILTAWGATWTLMSPNDLLKILRTD
jgi:2-phosphoglycolate phosphatase